MHDDGREGERKRDVGERGTRRLPRRATGRAFTWPFTDVTVGLCVGSVGVRVRLGACVQRKSETPV